MVIDHGSSIDTYEQQAESFYIAENENRIEKTVIYDIVTKDTLRFLYNTHQINDGIINRAINTKKETSSNSEIKQLQQDEWVKNLRKALAKTKKSITSERYNNKEITLLAIRSINGHIDVRKKIESAIETHFNKYNDDGNIDIRSLFNLIKYLPEISKINTHTLFYVDADLSAMMMSIHKENHTMHLLFKKNGEVSFNYTDDAMESIRISGSSYFSGELSKSSSIKKIFNMI